MSAASSHASDRPRLGIYGVATIVLLLPGWFGWFIAVIGLAMLWASPIWSVREKAVGTLIPFATSGLELLLLSPGHQLSTVLTVAVWLGIVGLMLIALGAIRVLVRGLR